MNYDKPALNWSYSDSYRNRIKKLLNGIPKDQMKKFQFTCEGGYSFTPLFIGQKICKEILKISETLNLEITQDSIITDATAGVGGITIELSKHFKYINAIEVNIQTRGSLLYNLHLLDINNVVVYNGYYQQYINYLQQDVIVIDAPWRPYINNNNITMFLDSPIGVPLIPLEYIVYNAILHSKMCVVKIPLNYDLDYFKQHIKYYGRIHYKIIIHYPVKIIILFIVKN